MASRPEHLEQAYRQTVYRILVGATPIDRRIGQVDAQADARLRDEAGCRGHWALVTAWNPRSRRCDEALNRRRQRRLQDRLGRLGQRWLPALHRSDGAWPDEESCLLIDPPPELPARLGRAFGQYAIVTGLLGQAPELLWLDDPPNPGSG